MHTLVYISIRGLFYLITIQLRGEVIIISAVCCIKALNVWRFLPCSSIIVQNKTQGELQRAREREREDERKKRETAIQREREKAVVSLMFKVYRHQLQIQSHAMNFVNYHEIFPLIILDIIFNTPRPMFFHG